MYAFGWHAPEGRGCSFTYLTDDVLHAAADIYQEGDIEVALRVAYLGRRRRLAAAQQLNGSRFDAQLGNRSPCAVSDHEEHVETQASFGRFYNRADDLDLNGAWACNSGSQSSKATMARQPAASDLVRVIEQIFLVSRCAWLKATRRTTGRSPSG